MATRNRSYSRESVQRALAHHELTGAVTFLSSPGQGQQKFRVMVNGVDDLLHLNLTEAFVLCCGLAASERVHTKMKRQPTSKGN